MNLPGKNNISKLGKQETPAYGIIYFFVYCFFFLSALLTAFFFTAPIAGAENPGDSGPSETEEAVLITDFFSDHTLCDSTVLFEKTLENVSLRITMSSGKEAVKSETFCLGPVEKGQEITKVFFWELPEDAGEERDSYTARLFVETGNETLASQKLSFSYKNAVLSNLRVLDFSASSEKASVLMSLKSQTGLGYVHMPEPTMVDLDLKLLSGGEVVYSESLENIPVMDACYKELYWPFLLEKGRDYTALLKVRSHSPALCTAYVSEFEAKEKVEILDSDVDVDEYGASITLTGKSRVPFDGILRVVLTPQSGEEMVFEETADLLTAGKEDTLGIIWQGIPQGDYNVRIYAVSADGEVLDSYETVLRVFEPAVEGKPPEESPAPGLPAALGIFLGLEALRSRKREWDEGGREL